MSDKHTYEYLRSVSPDLKIVKGRYDVEATSLPLTQVVTHGSLRIGFLEGFTLVSNEPDLLLAEANKLDVDVLCWGGTHRFDAFEYMDKFFVNPGSATGAFMEGFSQESEDPTPSFCLMDVCCLLFIVGDMITDTTLGSRHLTHPIRLSITKRRQGQRERGS